MKAKLKEGVFFKTVGWVITATLENGSYYILDDTIIFSDTPAYGGKRYNDDGEKLYWAINHDLSGCGFPEHMFDIIEE